MLLFASRLFLLYCPFLSLSPLPPLPPIFPMALPPFIPKQVVVVDKKAEEAQEAVQEIERLGGKAVAKAADIASPEDAKKTLTEVLEDSQLGRLDILVNNAAIYPPSSVATTSPELWDSVMAVNLRGLFFWTQAILNQMALAKGGMYCTLLNCCIEHLFHRDREGSEYLIGCCLVSKRDAGGVLVF